MANQIETKKITTLTENTDLSDTDQFPFGAGGGSGLRRIKWINIWNKILAKVRAALIIQNATTAATDKVASAAVTKNLQDQITEQNTNNATKPVEIAIADIGNILSVTAIVCFAAGNSVFVRVDAATKTKFVGWTSIAVGLPSPPAGQEFYFQTPNCKMRINRDGVLAMSQADTGAIVDTMFSYPTM